MTDIEKIWKEDAIDRLRENETHIQSLRERIGVLEFHLGKCRESAYQMCYATVGVLPLNFEDEVKPKKKAGKK